MHCFVLIEKRTIGLLCGLNLLATQDKFLEGISCRPKWEAVGVHIVEDVRSYSIATNRLYTEVRLSWHFSWLSSIVCVGVDWMNLQELAQGAGT
jgi:hypothetical protein